MSTAFLVGIVGTCCCIVGLLVRNDLKDDKEPAFTPETPNGLIHGAGHSQARRKIRWIVPLLTAPGETRSTQ